MLLLTLRQGRGDIRVGIIGGAGYTGGELIRLLINHPQANISFVHSNSNTGNKLYKVHEDLIGETELTFSGNEVLSKETLASTDILFLCTNHGEAKKFLEAYTIPFHVKIIDLSNDFRLQQSAFFHQPTESGHTFIRQFVYGLPEINKQKIKTAHNIANPGCFCNSYSIGFASFGAGWFVGRSLYNRYYRQHRRRTKPECNVSF